MTEAEIQSAVLEAWGAHPRLRLVRVNTGVGWYAKGQPARKSDAGAYPVKFNPAGTPDIVGIIAPSGRVLTMEIKTPRGKQSEEQQRAQRIITAFGGVYAVIRSLADADAVLIPLVGAR